MDIVKIRYSIQPRKRRYVKGYELLSFAKNIGKNITKNISNKYSQKLVDSAKKSTTYAINTASKRAIRKTAEATGDLIGHNIKIASVSKKSTKKLHDEELPSKETNNEIPKEIYMSPKERQQIIDEFRLI